MFSVIKHYAGQHPKGKSAMLYCSKALQDKVRDIIFILKEMKVQVDEDKRHKLSECIASLVASLYRLFVAVEADSLPTDSDIIRTVQQCAQLTSKVLNIAFGAVKENLEENTTSAVICCEKLYHYLNIKAPQIPNTEQRKQIVDSSTLIENKVTDMKKLAERYHQKNDPQIEEKLKHVAKLVIDEFRNVTVLLKSTHKTPSLHEEESEKLVANAFVTLKDVAKKWNETQTVMTPSEKKIARCLKELVENVGKIENKCMSVDPTILEDVLACVTNICWDVNSLAYPIVENCSEQEVQELMKLYLFSMRYYVNLFNIAAAAKFSDIKFTEKEVLMENMLHLATPLQGLLFCTALLCSNIVIGNSASL